MSSTKSRPAWVGDRRVYSPRAFMLTQPGHPSLGTGDGFGQRCEKNGEFSVAVGPVTIGSLAYWLIVYYSVTDITMASSKVKVDSFVTTDLKIYRVVQKNDTQFYFWDNFGNSASILAILSLFQAEIYGA